MKDAIGGGLLFNLVILFTTIIILFFAGILAYSKAYRIKNRIIEVVEKYERYDENVANILTNDLGNSGYIYADYETLSKKCGENSLTVTNEFVPGYLYCIYEKPMLEGKTYEVVTYINFNFPVINDLITLKVKGETKTIGKNYNY